jgi:DNA invertase Pin-like site-specific DNA recombinase
MSFNKLYKERGKMIEVNLQRRNTVISKMRRHAKKRETQARANAKLDREFITLVTEARALFPPLSTYEIERLTNVSSSTVHRYIQANNIPTAYQAVNE